ncbi:hypothetical protein ECANGB1_1838 [Enterospora canceri]|uniref:Uncharacterized protein n=1 Tax=Enterospora canceri TaxID=1081671 RepID=A0A1Y1S5G6_9MICR|nr:hypothetical protein ECANGB1_1838 [Enterospora canceri]
MDKVAINPVNQLEYVKEVVSQKNDQNEIISTQENRIEKDVEEIMNSESMTTTELTKSTTEQIVHKQKTHQKPPEHLRPFYFNKFPGQIHLVIEEIRKINVNKFGDEFFILRVEYPDGYVESPEYSVEKTVTTGFHLKIPIAENSKTKIRVLVLQSKKRKQVATSEIIIDNSLIKSVHNRLAEMKRIFRKVGGFFDIFSNDTRPVANECRIFISYLAVDEIPTINSIAPHSLLTLSKWLVARKYAYDLLFSGFVNVKGDINDTTKFLWKHRYIKWYGYTLYIFNDKTKKLVSTINVTDAAVNTSGIKKGNVVFYMKREKLEIHSDSKENLKNIKSVTGVLFPASKLCNNE